MHREIQLTLSPEEAYKTELLNAKIAEELKISSEEISRVRTLRKSIDARSPQIKINLLLEVYWNEIPTIEELQKFNYQDVSQKEAVVVVGYGPAGLFGALRLIELGYRPIVLERGKEVRERKKDIAQLSLNKAFNAESNYCFGEGGAGTFSDGKLYTRSKKKGNTRRINEIFHAHGANENILYEAHPHIGTDKLPLIIKKMSNTIRDCGGEIHFEEKMCDLLIENGAIKGCITESGKQFDSRALLLGTGHSAHDIYELLDAKGIALELTGFAMGVRVEHPQALIDSIQYKSETRSEYLPAASYNLAAQVNGRGVYSFCMCPGGQIVPATSEENHVIVNGMSASIRNSAYANSGIVVEIRPEDIPNEFKQYGNLAGLKYQRHLEHLAFENNGGAGYAAPAQALVDFVEGRLSKELPKCSYLPGVVSSPLHSWLPTFISKRLRKGFKLFDQQMRGYLTNDAIILGVESRSSSAVRIPRNKENMQHPDISGLFPCGEGSGYSGGITSSAVDGENAADKIAEFLKSL